MAFSINRLAILTRKQLVFGADARTLWKEENLPPLFEGKSMNVKERAHLRKGNRVERHRKRRGSLPQPSWDCRGDQ